MDANGKQLKSIYGVEAKTAYPLPEMTTQIVFTIEATGGILEGEFTVY